MQKLTQDFLQAFSKASRSCEHCCGTTSPRAVPRALGGVPDASTHAAYASLAAWQRLRAERRTEASVAVGVSEAEDEDAEDEENMHWGEVEERGGVEKDRNLLDEKRVQFFFLRLVKLKKKITVFRKDSFFSQAPRHRSPLSLHMPALPAPGRASALSRSSATFSTPRASSVRAAALSASSRATSSKPTLASLSRRPRLSLLLPAQPPRATSGARRAMSAPQAAAGESCIFRKVASGRESRDETGQNSSRIVFLDGSRRLSIDCRWPKQSRERERERERGREKKLNPDLP